MWLINTSTLKLEYFIDHRDPELFYAILSHTWDEGEVTFQEFNSGLEQIRLKPGYRKIVQTCARALEQGYKHGWVDTCCINKESSAELSEAINSMWAWYSCANICYVYLSDVDGACPVLGHEDDTSLFDLGNGEDRGDEEVSTQPSFWPRHFRGSRWFTRGWTLQELIAPSRINFFNREWEFIGSKKNLVGELAMATGIDRAAIKDRTALKGFVIARKMSWAAGRKTSRIEDRAYSLLGIFDVNMPLLYGEGDNAFVRLQEHLVRTTTDRSILVWTSRNESDNMLWPDIDRLFATSPDDFRIGSKVVRWFPSLADSHHILTSKGLEFHSSIFIKGETRSLILLDCRFEDNLNGPLALRLCQHRKTVSGARVEWSHKNDYCIDLPYDEPVHSLDNRLKDTRRLAIYAGFKTATRQPGVFTALRYEPEVFKSFFDPRRISWPPKIWLKKADSSEEDFEITSASPARLWNKLTRVMYYPKTKPVQDGDLVELFTALLRFDPSGRNMRVSLRFHWQTMLENQFRPELSISMGNNSAETFLSSNKEFQMADAHNHVYSAHLELSEVIGDRVYIVHIARQSAGIA